MTAGRSRHGLGYILIRTIPGRNGKRELEHRLVMENMLGRKLSSKEVVHHKNHDRADNRPENLELCASAGIHSRDHHPLLVGFWNGKKFSEEHRKKISDSIKIWWSKGGRNRI